MGKKHASQYANFGWLRVMEELHDNIVYIGLDNDFYSTYQEILKKIPLQKILENGILVSMDNA